MSQQLVSAKRIQSIAVDSIVSKDYHSIADLLYVVNVQELIIYITKGAERLDDHRLPLKVIYNPINAVHIDDKASGEKITSMRLNEVVETKILSSLELFEKSITDVKNVHEIMAVNLNLWGGFSSQN